MEETSRRGFLRGLVAVGAGAVGLVGTPLGLPAHNPERALRDLSALTKSGQAPVEQLERFVAAHFPQGQLPPNTLRVAVTRLEHRYERIFDGLSRDPLGDSLWPSFRIRGEFEVVTPMGEPLPLVTLPLSQMALLQFERPERVYSPL